MYELIIYETLSRFRSHENRAALASSCPSTGHDHLLAVRIVGGLEAKIGEYPWLALIGYAVGHHGNIQYRCGGSLIGDKYVLTAAHCVTNLPTTYKVYAFKLIAFGYLILITS